MIQRNISYSQIKSWHECRRAWAYKFRDGYRPIKPKLEFMRGSLLHLGMEHCVLLPPSQFGTGWGQALQKWAMEWSPAGELVIEPGWVEGCAAIVQGAVEIFNRDWKILYDDTGPLLERRMYLNLDRYYKGVVFIPDVLAERKTGPFAGATFVVDFKSFGKPKEEIAGDVDIQGPIYQLGVQQKGWGAIGTALFQIATEPRPAVRIRKDGQPYVGDQERHDNWCAVKGEIITPRSDEFLAGIWEQMILPTIHEMYDAELRGTNDVLPPSMDYYGCKFCEFFEPCQARLKGHDEDAILADAFKRREQRQKGV